MNADKVNFSIRQNAAIDFARMYHKTQRRKGTPVPYLIHPMEVAYFCGLYYPDNKDLIIAGYLHDVLEDTDATASSISNLFGPRVTYLVEGVTVKETGSWTLLRQTQIEKIIDAVDGDVVRLKAADMLSNSQSIVRDIRAFGSEALKKFKSAKPSDILWYYTTMVSEMQVHMKEPLIDELMLQVEAMREEINVNALVR